MEKWQEFNLIFRHAVDEELPVVLTLSTGELIYGHVNVFGTTGVILSIKHPVASSINRGHPSSSLTWTEPLLFSYTEVNSVGLYCEPED